MLTDKEKLEQHLKKFKYVSAEVRNKILNNLPKTYEFSSIPVSYIVYDAFTWDDTKEGWTYWENMHDYIADAESGKNAPKLAGEILQSEKQQLLSILREELKDCEEIKELLKGYSSTLWGNSIKGTPEGEEAFRRFSKVHSSAKELKKKTVKIANLIKKVKAL